MRFITPLLCCSFALVSAGACSSGSRSDDSAPPAGIGDGELPGKGCAEPPEAPGASADGSSASGDTGAGSEEPEPKQPVPPRAGIITAGAWDDNRNFARFLGYRSALAATALPGLLPITEKELSAANKLWTQPRPTRERLDISLVIDTTGSMGDEIRYLQAEFNQLSSTIAAQYPGSEQRWSLVVYRDTGDEYVARWFDFRADPQDFRRHLDAQSAGGGGDFPEAPEAAFAALSQLAWRADEATARLAFWVADAPHHDDKKDELAEGLRTMQSLGVHVYPVASSGVDELTELSMRTAAALTGGRYLFLTNDSGVGNDHKEPTIPCYFVTSLSDAIARMVDIELSGQYREPAAEQIIRTGGNPRDGACKLASGQNVFVF